jgi:flagellar hook-length control protein FliK
MQVNAGGGEVRLTLTPEHLGTVNVDVRVSQDRVTATLTADTPQVRQWIAAHQDDLKNSLASAGLSLDELVVKDESGGGRQEPPADEQQHPARRQTPAHDDGDTQFEVIV